jgi:hypothetical protein
MTTDMIKLSESHLRARRAIETDILRHIVHAPLSATEYVRCHVVPEEFVDQTNRALFRLLIYYEKVGFYILVAKVVQIAPEADPNEVANRLAWLVCRRPSNATVEELVRTFWRVVDLVPCEPPNGRSKESRYAALARQLERVRGTQRQSSQ